MTTMAAATTRGKVYGTPPYQGGVDSAIAEDGVVRAAERRLRFTQHPGNYLKD